MITLQKYLTQHSAIEDVPPEVAEAGDELLGKVNALLEHPDCPNPNAELRSGYRPPAYNAKTKGAASKSTHMFGHGIDVADNDGAIDAWLTDEILEQYGLYREHPNATSTWVHLQDVPPGSGRRTYIPF
jgi:hypothetical protein